MYKVEKNVPIPIKRANSKNNFVSILRSMEVGDSILFDRTKIKPSSFYVSARRLGFKITVREIDEKQSRLWRIE
jgi:S-adenosylmethionine:tRNA-ribosyltransferase-isomerase (queuine synthetase)|tara:strand:+ start:103 stop:324 length:222 start_codon:yes stop_codon:yes gene_type:complete